jgi:Concanavalin A-like lectin/glucanases superfamily
MNLNRTLGALAALLAVTSAVPARAALVGYYAFENSGDLGQDSSGLGNNLLSFGTGVSYASSGNGAGSSGLSLTGSGGLSTASGDAPSLFPVGNADYTLSVDFKTTVVGSLGLIGWGTYSTLNATNALRTSATGIRNYWWNDDLDATGTVADNAWHNVLASFDGTTRRIYLDGALAASDTPGGVNHSTAANFAVGRTNVAEYFKGTLDNVAVFDTALTPTQVQQALPAVRRVPEPMTLTLLGTGVMLLGWQNRRRRAS